MNRYKVLMIIVCCISGSMLAYGQRETVWAFGSSAGLDFNILTNGLPTPIHTNSRSESGVSICDDTDNLLFYTNGSKVWDRYHNVMPNGDDLTGLGLGDVTFSSMMPAVIFPFTSDPKRYYIFSITQMSSGGLSGGYGGKLYYSIVDMDLNNSVGDVDINNSGIFLDDGLQESIIVIPGNHCDYWVVGITYHAHQDNSTPPSLFRTLKAYHVTEDGVDPIPSTSSIPVFSIWNQAPATFKSSYDHNRFAMPYAPFSIISGRTIWSSGAGFRLYDFDRNTGLFSNELLISDSSLHYTHNICFSPDNSKLYLSSWEITNTDTFSIISQFDISSNNVNAIKNSRQVIYRGQKPNGWQYNPMKIGPDGKLYISHYPTMSMSVIPDPNLTPPSCGLWEDTIDFSTVPGIGNSLGYVFSNHLGLPDPFSDTLSNSFQVCDYSLLTPEDTNGWNYTWNDGLRDINRDATYPGLYWVSYETFCTYHIDTFMVETAKEESITEVICDYEYVTFGGSRITESGTYRDTLVASNGCDSIITLNLIARARPELNILTPQEMPLCIGDSITLQATGARRYQWFARDLRLGNNPTQETVLAQHFNQLSVIGEADNTCLDTAALDIIADVCCDLFIPNAFSPNQDGMNDGFAPVMKSGGHIRNYQLQIFNRLGQQVFSSFTINDPWDGTYNGTPADAGVYFYYITGRCLEGTEIVHKGDVTLIR